MGQYKHLSLEEREDIMVSRSHGKSVGEIARQIGRSKSTVSREIKRNSLPAGPAPGRLLPGAGGPAEIPPPTARLRQDEEDGRP